MNCALFLSGKRRRVNGELHQAWRKKRPADVPSVVVPKERNVLLNSSHPGMSEVSAVDVEDYSFDSRLARHR